MQLWKECKHSIGTLLWYRLSFLWSWKRLLMLPEGRFCRWLGLPARFPSVSLVGHRSSCACKKTKASFNAMFDQVLQRHTMPLADAGPLGNQGYREQCAFQGASIFNSPRSAWPCFLGLGLRYATLTSATAVLHRNASAHALIGGSWSQIYGTTCAVGPQ